MSGHSSEDEVMDDGLNIKPPQHVHRHHKDRKRDRSHRHPTKSRKGIPEDDRMRHHQHQHRPHSSRDRDQEIMQRVRSGGRSNRDGGVMIERVERYPQHLEKGDGHRSRSGGRNYNSGGPISEGGGPMDMDRQQSSSSRRHKSSGSSSSKRNELMDPEMMDMKSRDSSRRTRDMLSEAKEKRRYIEMENERALREIERRREREKGDESSSSSSRHRRSHRPVVDKVSSPEEIREELRLDDLEIQEIEESSSELEEGEERTPLTREEVEEHSHSDKERISSMSENEHEEEEQHQQSEEAKEKATSDVSSATSSSRKSRSDGRSDVSSSSSSSDDTDSEHENEQTNGDSGPKPAKVARKDSPQPSPLNIEPKDESEVSQEKTNEQINAIPVVTVTSPEEEDNELLPPYLPALQGCRRVEEFQLLNRIEEGTYGVVYRAKEKRTDEVVALKRLKMEKEKDGFPITSLREINTLLKAQHENIVTVREIVVGSNTDKIFLVMDYVEHDLKALMETLKQKGQVFLVEEVKCLMIQLLRAVAHLHDNWILHRDLKTSNLLLSHKGILKVGDFGLAREYGSPLKSYTPIVVTLWYRAPELLLGTKEYSTPIDVWSVGCIFGELLKMEPMFPGKSEANQLNLIFQSLGTPNDRIWPGYTQMPLLQKMTFADYPVNKLKTRFGHLTELGIDLMNKFLTFNPAKRVTAEDALDHGFFKELPAPIDPSMFPTWPAKSEMGHRKAAASPKPPSGGQQFKGLNNDEDSSGFFLGGGDARRQPLGAGFSLKF